jgi:hypothetical protein
MNFRRTFNDWFRVLISPRLQKKWDIMVKKGEVNAKGEYVGDDAEVSDAPEASGSVRW